MACVHCEECGEDLPLDKDGEVIGNCPAGNLHCEHASMDLDDDYAPLNFHEEI